MTGIRARAAFALAVVSVVSIGILALVLLGPLESRLRDDEVAGLAQAARSARTSLEAVDADGHAKLQRRLRQIARSVRRTAGGEVAIVDASGRVIADTDPDSRATFPEAIQAIRTGDTQRIGVSRSDGEAHVAVPARIRGAPAAVALRKPLTETRQAAAVVRRAFLVGALISLFLALLLGLALASGLSRRLTALRDTALRVADIGPVAEMRRDPARDEVGDLNRAFVSMQERLREQEEARRAFVATASHELRTPLSSLQIMLDILRADLDAEPPDLADARDQARRAEAQSERLSGLAGELLDLSRLDAGVELRVEPVELGESVRSVVAELELRAGEAGTALRTDVPEPVWSRADPGAVAQVVRILADNALRYGGGTVLVGAHARTDGPEITVADEGPGVAAEDRERIFERFRRGAGAEGGGFGLGLAIARELAERMGGTLTLDGGATTGARFVLRLPADPGPTPA